MIRHKSVAPEYTIRKSLITNYFFFFNSLDKISRVPHSFVLEIKYLIVITIYILNQFLSI